MARCKDCIHNDVCRYHDKLAKIDEYNWFSYNELDNVQDFCEHFIADVVPKSEVERLRFNLEAVLEEIPETKREVAREIFEEIEKTLDNSVETEYFKGTWFNLNKCMQRIAELKKKYTEEKQ